MYEFPYLIGKSPREIIALAKMFNKSFSKAPKLKWTFSKEHKRKGYKKK